MRCVDEISEDIQGRWKEDKSCLICRRHIHDNKNLLKLVQRFPDEISHDVMVPFGKAAFFPGCLIRTNEFLVLLGERYYAERTSKQTVDILHRRGKVLDSQVDSLKAVMVDLKAEASFFDSTATEAAIHHSWTFSMILKRQRPILMMIKNMPA
ncbi:Rna polymerase ii subunit 5-mediating protein-like protein [Thalictrum thalictroides]|uniref:Rna polymerase ii subunit 5-mediating protein-like protein n=1 Tax=Thalictrum thalictroides TaxID=46969 RepID=A0A7J6VM04_THATH|nr:Rna polymerase ii subunit 5-mediating protein-like protein [Thalictrum thalictroides]